MKQILEIVFRREPEIYDLKYLFKIFFILIILSILNPGVVLLGAIVYFCGGPWVLPKIW
jgi:hypothetical protein